MKKFLTLALVLLLAVIMGVISVFAIGNNKNYVDENSDGVCDNAEICTQEEQNGNGGNNSNGKKHHNGNGNKK